MSRCGRCHGRGWIRHIRGVGQRDCPVCKGTGERTAELRVVAQARPKLTNPSGPCACCGNPSLEFHHVVSVQRLRRLVLADELNDAIADPRNLVATCRPCHERIERAMLHLTVDQLPEHFWRFVAEYDLVGAVPRHLMEDAA